MLILVALRSRNPKWKTKQKKPEKCIQENLIMLAEMSNTLLWKKICYVIHLRRELQVDHKSREKRFYVIIIMEILETSNNQHQL